MSTGDAIIGISDHGGWAVLVTVAGGGTLLDRRRVELTEEPADLGQDPHDLLALDEAITALGREDPVKAELVRLRYFAGLTLEEAAACLGISLATVKRQWAVARAWLYRALSGDNPPRDENP